jgi:hypothetical protein
MSTSAEIVSPATQPATVATRSVTKDVSHVHLATTVTQQELYARHAMRHVLAAVIALYQVALIVRMVITEKGMNASHVMKTVKHVLIIMYV